MEDPAPPPAGPNDDTVPPVVPPIGPPPIIPPRLPKSPEKAPAWLKPGAAAMTAYLAYKLATKGRGKMSPAQIQKVTTQLSKHVLPKTKALSTKVNKVAKGKGITAPGGALKWNPKSAQEAISQGKHAGKTLSMQQRKDALRYIQQNNLATRTGPEQMVRALRQPGGDLRNTRHFPTHY